MSARIAKGGGRAAAPRSKARSGGGSRGGGSRAVSTRRAKPDEGLFESWGFEPGAARRILGWSMAALGRGQRRRRDLRLPPAAARRPRHRRGHRPDGLHPAPRRERAAIAGSRRSAIYNIAFSQDSPAMPLVDLDAHARAAARAALDRRGAGVAPAARHVGDRGGRARRRSRSGRMQPAADADRRRRASCSSRCGSRRCPICRG